MSSRRGAVRLWHLLLVALVVGAILALFVPPTICHPRSKSLNESASFDAKSEFWPTAAPETNLRVSVVDRAGYDAIVDHLRGKVVLVDFWATWCGPCVEQLPHTLDLGKRLADRGLAVVTVSCDEPAEAPRVAEFLRGKDADGATHLISQFGGSPQTMEEFRIESGAVPFYKLYDRTGRLRQTFGINPAAKTQFTSADIDAAVDRLLNR